MRSLKTAASIMTKDLKFLFGFVRHKEFWVVMAAVLWAASTLCFVEYIPVLYPGGIEIMGEWFQVALLFGYIGFSLAIIYFVMLVIRTKKRVKHENKRLLNTLKGGKDGPSADWID